MIYDLGARLLLNDMSVFNVYTSKSVGSRYIPNTLQIIHMVAHSNKQIKEPLMTLLHFSLHSSALLEDLPCANNHSQIMSAQLRVRVRRVVVRVPGRPQDYGNWDPVLEALLAEGKALQVFQAILFGCAVYDGVTEDYVTSFGVEDGCFV